LLAGAGATLEAVSGATGAHDPDALPGHIENFIGYAQIPMGVIGPLRINGSEAHGDYYVPLATSEGALVASYHRGAWVASQAGGVTAVCLTEAVSRAPCFVFDRLAEAGRFTAHALASFDALQEVAAGQSRYARLIDLRPCLTGKELYLLMDFTTGDAAGQNMVTLAADALARHLIDTSPVKPRRWYVEGNLSGDKKATQLAYTFARGKKVVAEAVIPAPLLRRLLHVSAADMHDYWQISVVGGAQSGSIGVQGHFANALAALFLACGQDVACVAEAAVGLTRMDVTGDDALYVSVTLPNLIVGTVGGGTNLPTARDGLDLLGCRGEGRARAFAEICAATALAGELSIIAAMAAGHFTSAHARYGR
jgi:hydroxymethylglutaryl-CoA reductase (NADPH)